MRLTVPCVSLLRMVAPSSVHSCLTLAPFCIRLTSPHPASPRKHPIHSDFNTLSTMAPRKKPEEKASGEEAADMILHYLRKAHLDLARHCEAKTHTNHPQASRTDLTRPLIYLRTCTTR